MTCRHSTRTDKSRAAPSAGMLATACPVASRDGCSQSLRISFLVWRLSSMVARTTSSRARVAPASGVCSVARTRSFSACCRFLLCLRARSIPELKIRRRPCTNCPNPYTDHLCWLCVRYTLMLISHACSSDADLARGGDPPRARSAGPHMLPHLSLNRMVWVGAAPHSSQLDVGCAGK